MPEFWHRATEKCGKGPFPSPFFYMYEAPPQQSCKLSDIWSLLPKEGEMINIIIPSWHFFTHLLCGVPLYQFHSTLYPPCGHNTAASILHMMTIFFVHNQYHTIPRCHNQDISKALDPHTLSTTPFCLMFNSETISLLLAVLFGLCKQTYCCFTHSVNTNDTHRFSLPFLSLYVLTIFSSGTLYHLISTPTSAKKQLCSPSTGSLLPIDHT
jgi:hypothetical protein